MTSSKAGVFSMTSSKAGVVSMTSSKAGVVSITSSKAGVERPLQQRVVLHTVGYSDPEAGVGGHGASDGVLGVLVTCPRPARHLPTQIYTTVTFAI